jgi:hypothetical protein
VVVGNPSTPVESIVLVVQSVLRLNYLRLPLGLGGQLRRPRKRWPNKQTLNGGIQGHGRLGTSPANQFGLLLRLFRTQSSRCSPVCQTRSSDHGLECLAGMRAGFARATDRIRGIGNARRYYSLNECLRSRSLLAYSTRRLFLRLLMEV